MVCDSMHYTEYANKRSAIIFFQNPKKSPKNPQKSPKISAKFPVTPNKIANNIPKNPKSRTAFEGVICPLIFDITTYILCFIFDK